MLRLRLSTKIKFYFEPRDLWVGLYWDRIPKEGPKDIQTIAFYICLLPTLVIKIYKGIKF